MTGPSVISGDLKESLERLVEKVNSTSRSEAEEQPSPAALATQQLSNVSLGYPLLPRGAQARGTPAPPVQGHFAHLVAPMRLISGSIGSGSVPGAVATVQVAGRMVSSQTTSQPHLRPEGAPQVQTVCADDSSSPDDGNVQALREKVHEALMLQQDPAQPPNRSRAPAPAGAMSPRTRKSGGTSWHAQVTAVLQQNQQVPPRAADLRSGVAASHSGPSLPVTARAREIYSQTAAGPTGSYTGPISTPGPPQTGQANQRTLSPVQMHRGVSPVVYRQPLQHGAMQRTLSPMRPKQLG